MLTPAMQQYMTVKQKYPDCIILFRMGDFYEMFYEDAKTASKELGIALTSRGKGDAKAPLAGIPHHSVEPYIAKLVKKGYRLALCEQMEDPRFAKGVVKRDVVRIITPGTLIEHDMLDSRCNNYIAAIANERDRHSLSLADISTGEFLVTEPGSWEKIENELQRFNPAETIIPLSLEGSGLAARVRSLGCTLNTYDDRHFWHEKASALLKEHFKVLSLDGFGCTELSINAAGALLSYLKETQKTRLEYINRIQLISDNEFMLIDGITQKNLELMKNLSDGTARGTLVSIMDRTLTPLGSRLLKRWLLHPLLDIARINQRLDAVEELTSNILLRNELGHALSGMQDIERLISRIAYGKANARDLVSLKNSLVLIPEIKKALSIARSLLLSFDIKDLAPVAGLIEKGIKDEPSAMLYEGNLIREGFSERLDSMRSIASNARSFIAALEDKEKTRTGIRSLKIRYNKVFGYFIEVTKPNLHLVPPNYIRKQTQVNSERFVTEELKEQEALILGSEEKIIALEYELFVGIVEGVKKEHEAIQQAAEKIAVLDVLLSFANLAVENRYARPVLTTDYDIIIKNGRHPVIETLVETFIPNDCCLTIQGRFMIITGPNMAGKSCYLRQVVLVTLMAQVGSFVPASEARIGIVDRIFSRVGAHDDISRGQSTFMTEMTETANILNNATERSLLILDEIGRGTSTFDGISIAWSVAEYIHNNIRAKTLFATHFHQLNNLADELEGIKNYNIAVNEEHGSIIFLRKIVEGSTNKSYGIQVARLAGLPLEVIERSKGLMKKLEEDSALERLFIKSDKQKTFGEKWR